MTKEWVAPYEEKSAFNLLDEAYRIEVCFVTYAFYGIRLSEKGVLCLLKISFENFFSQFA